MEKKKLDHRTGTKGIYIYNPNDPKPRYYLQFRYGKNPRTGKPVVIKKMVDKNGEHLTSIKKAKEFMNELKEELDRDKDLSFDNHMRYFDFMNEMYIPAYKTDVKASTFSVRKKTLENIRDRFGHLKLKDISAQHVQDYRTYLLSDASYSQSYASLVFGMFRKSLDLAIKLNYLDTNISKKIPGIPKGKTPVLYWTKEEFEKILAQIYVEDYYQHLNFVMLWLYFVTGVRVNEGCALYWNDIDFKHKRMQINHMLDITNQDNWIRNNYTKTEAGIRTITLDDDTLKILQNWKKRQEEHCDSDFIFSYNGKPMLKSTIARVIQRYSKLAGVHPIQAKGLRHSHASYLINEFNVDILMLSRRLGHSSPEITLKHYSHLYPNRDGVIADHITGNIKIETSKENHIAFNGNQAIKK